MQASPIHDCFDASVLFASREAAQAAWRALTGSEAAGFTLSKGNLTAILELKSEAMPDAILDLRLVGANFDVGAAYIGIVLGVMGQFEIRQMLTNPATGQGYPDPWASTGLVRVASQVVSELLAAGGTAVVLHKAGATVKSAAMFRAELGDLDDVTQRPAAAWLDLTANHDGVGGIVARSFGIRPQPSRAAGPRAFRQYGRCDARRMEEVRTRTFAATSRRP